MASYLMAIEFGPVQEFIAAGRKTRDLWLGSTLLSRTAGVVAAALIGDWNATMIFPAIDDVKSIKPADSFPDKLLAKLDHDAPDDVARELETTARNYLLAELELVLAGLHPGFVHKEFARRQVQSFLDFYAAWVPLASEDEYATQRDRVERLLLARTMIRDFEPAPPLAHFPGDSFDANVAGEQERGGVAKSSLDPGRETVLRAHGRPASAHNTIDDPNVRSQLRIKRGEQLDGISLLKRLGDVQRFVSVSRITIDPFIRRLARDCPETLKELCSQAEEMAKANHPSVDRLKIDQQPDLERFAEFPYDTQLFFDPSASDDDLNENQKQQAKDFFDIVCTVRHDLNIGELTNKGAILSADGDQMGNALSKRKTINAHRTFDAKIAAFARDARSIIGKHQGAAIYTGGDDVLAMLPLDRALACADALRKRFDQLNSGEDEEIPNVSLSVGIAVGHYTTHLQSLLRWSRAALYRAKDEGGRNALAVTIHTGDSQKHALKGIHSWDVNPVETRWNRWISWYRRGAISRGAGYELRDLAASYRDLIKDDASIASKLIDRKYADPDEKRNPAHTINSSLLELEVLHLLTSKRPDTTATMAPDDVKALRDAVGASIPGLEQLADELIAALHFVEAIAIADDAIVEETQS